MIDIFKLKLFIKTIPAINAGSEFDSYWGLNFEHIL